MKKILVSIPVIGWLAICLAPADEMNLPEQVALPPNVVSFITAKEQSAYRIVAQNDFTLPPEVAYYFAAAKAGRARAARQIYSGLLADTNSPAYRSPLKQAALDAELALEAFAAGDATLVQSLGEDLMKSLPPGCIYFGGTDPGRGLPTLLCRSPGDPVFVLSQNAFLDGRYLQYIREMYGAHIQLPATNEVKEITEAAYAGKTNHNFNARNAWTTASGQVLRSIIAKNPGREFYYEESFQLDDLSSNLSPHGLVMKIAPQPLNTLSTHEINADADFWAAKIMQLKDDPKFSGDHYTSKTYAHERAASAGLYAWRAQAAQDANERERMFEAATNAFGQAMTLNPGLPETIYREVNLFLAFGQADEAMAVAQSALANDPSNATFKNLIVQLRARVSPAPAAEDKSTPSAADRLKQLESLYQQGLISRDDYEKKKREILNSL